MNHLIRWSPVWVFLLLAAFSPRSLSDHKTLALGAAAPDFSLEGVDGKRYQLSSFHKAKILVVVFTCNHCPTAQAYEDRIIQLTADYASKNVAVVAIMPNDPRSLRLDELDFSDIGDSFDDMKVRANEKHFNFPYLYDGNTQEVSKAYGPVATPHVFIFDQDRKLRYQGRVDDTENPFKTPSQTDARNAIDDLLNNRDARVQSTKVFGCSIKWSEKQSSVEEANNRWAKEPVELATIGVDSLQRVLKNSSNKLYLIHIWAMSSQPSYTQFPQFVAINRMYRDRDFEFITICVDDNSQQSNALALLRMQHASNTNYMVDSANRNTMTKAVHAHWNGDLPYTIVVEPCGEIVYAQEGLVDPALLKKTIVNNHLLGKYP